MIGHPRHSSSASALGLFLALSGLGLAACTSLGLMGPEVSTNPCQNIDWFELGRRDGVMGRPPRDNPLIRQCEQTADFQLNREAFEAGFNKGLVDYCTPERAYQMGRSGQPYSGVCPAELEDEVIGAHLKGKRLAQRLAELEEENAQIEIQIEALLTDPNSRNGDPTLLNELGQLTGLGRQPATGGKTSGIKPSDSSVQPVSKEAQLKLLRERRAQLNLEIQDAESNAASSSRLE